MLQLYDNISINSGINFLIMQSEVNKDKFFNLFNQTECSAEEVLTFLSLSKKDFTDSDWKEISRCF